MALTVKYIFSSIRFLTVC